MMSIARVAAGNALYWLVALAVAHYSLRRRRSHALPRDGEESVDDEADNDALTKLAITRPKISAARIRGFRAALL